MKFKEGTPLYASEVHREGEEDVLYLNYLGAPYVPDLADFPEVMERTIDALIENPNVSRIVFVQQKNYNYDFAETSLLMEIAHLYVHLLKQEKVLSQDKISPGNNEFFSQRYNEIFSFLFLLRRDPILAYNELRGIVMRAKILLDKLENRDKFNQKSYLNFLEKIFGMFEKTKIIMAALDYINDYRRGDREIYHRIFKPDVIPNFTFTRLVFDLPDDAEIVDQYKIAQESYDESLVTILRKKDESKLIYHLSPPENSLDESSHFLLNLAKGVLIEHQPKAEEFTDTERVRQVFFNIAKDLLQDLAQSRGVYLDYSRLNQLSTILVRHTIGFGLIEVLLQDKNIQDIVLNSPISMTHIFLRHQNYGECFTNILPSQEDADSWAAKFRMISGRPLDEANPILDTQLAIGNMRARIAIIQQPLSPDGLAYAIRRHREEPWTLPLFVKNKMINPFAAGLFSFLISGSRTMLVAGTRSSGKCVDGNTLIQLSDGNLKKIKNLLGKEKKRINDGIIYFPNGDFDVPSLEGMNLSSKKISDVWKRDSPEKLIKIKTKTGKEIITTKEHPYFVYESKLKNKRADELKRGELIASPRKLFINGGECEMDLSKNEFVFNEDENFYFLKGKTNSQVVKFPKKLTVELAEFLGLVIGDGHLDKLKLEFYNSNEFLRNKYISLVRVFGLNYRVFKSKTTSVVQINSRVLNNILNKVFDIPFGKKSDKVCIPEKILKSGEKILAGFLRGYFDTDGYVSQKKSLREIELATASKLMSEQLKLVLLRFGVVSFVKPKEVNGKRYYRILIRGKFVKNFAKEIGFNHLCKKEKLDLLISKNFLENTNTDVIPEGNRMVKELRAKLRVSSKQHRECGKDYWAYENNEYRVSRDWFKKIVEFYQNRYNELFSLRSQINSLRKFVNFNLNNYLLKLETLRKFVGMSYASLASRIGMSECGLRKSLQMQRTNDLTTLSKVSGIVNVLEMNNPSQQENFLLNELALQNVAINSFSAGIILSNLRSILNISNEELSEKISIGSVSNFFNGVYNPSFRVLQLISKKILEIYDSAISEEARGLILEAEELANSDIFWDEVISVEEINKTNEFVYDLSVEDTHNFVANGLIAHNTSLLGSLMLEIIPKFRIIVIEDSLELPVESLRNLNYDILRMKVRSALLKTTTEVSAEDGIRTSLRLGDSCLIIGEVRSKEAKALYEAMRVGALANVVAGTIHGASPYGVFDRVVNDLGVPATSFKATDIVAVANPIKSADGLSSKRRVLQLAEVRKHWKKDPLQEKGFVDLLRYNVEKDELEPTEDLINGDSEVVKDIASNVKGWAGNWDAVYDNIILRAKIKKELVEVSNKINNEKILEAKFSSLANHMFYKISSDIQNEIGLPVGTRVFPEWKKWLNEEVKKRKIQ